MAWKPIRACGTLWKSSSVPRFPSSAGKPKNVLGAPGRVIASECKGRSLAPSAATARRRLLCSRSSRVSLGPPPAGRKSTAASAPSSKSAPLPPNSTSSSTGISRGLSHLRCPTRPRPSSHHPLPFWRLDAVEYLPPAREFRMTRHTNSVHTLICPNCGSDRVRRSLRKGTEDWLYHHLFLKNPYHCGDCDERFFRSRLVHHDKREPRQLSTS